MGSVAQAQDAENQFQMNASLGFGGVLVAERWNPLTLTISSGGEAVNGAFEITYAQDASQVAKITVPFATTPHRDVPVTAFVCPPASCVEMNIKAFNARGRELASASFVPIPQQNSSGSTRLEFRMPTVHGPRHVVVGVVGDVQSLNSASRVWRDVLGGLDGSTSTQSQYSYSRAPARPVEEVFGSIDVVTIDPDLLPRTCMGYDSLTALVIHPASIDSVDERSIQAIRLWVQAGGRLIVLATEPGSAWQRWVPEGVLETEFDSGMVTSRDPAPVQTPRELQRVMTDFVSKETKQLSGVMLSETATARTFRLSDRAKTLGWSENWRVSGDESSIAVQGPLGFGYVMLVGARPEFLPSAVRDVFSAGLWRQLLTPILKKPIRTMEGDSSESRDWYWSGAYETSEEIQQVIAQIQRTPHVSLTVLYWILLVPLTIVALLGVADLFVLKRLNRRELNWLTAALWLAVLSVVAYTVPLWIRRGPSMARRVVLVESVQMPGQSLPIACVTQAIGLYANSSQPSKLADESVDGSFLQSQWWRGLEPSWSSYGSGRGFQQSLIGPRVETLQIPGAWDTAMGGNSMEDHRVAQWTFRAIASRCVEPAPVRVQLERTSSGTRIVVTGLDRDANVEVALAEQMERWNVASEVEDETAALHERVFMTRNSMNLSQSMQVSVEQARAMTNFEPSFSSNSIFDDTAPDVWRTVVIRVERNSRSGQWDRESTTVYRIMVPMLPTAEDDV
ncbi:MAG: hypothetical protein H6815_09185 [Phycisphaeraceae bacterium]|nr:hypothetical protein [Phycisphaerales bacterium]MCB9860611.1 hypothetical protein [Phycisphaeraceae bacterium]